MDFLLISNADAALIGDLGGNVRTETRPAHWSQEEWQIRVNSDYLEPEHGYDEEGMPFTNLTGDFRWVNGQVKVVRLDGVKPFETFSDEAYGLTVRAVFLPHLNQWAIAE